MEIRGESPRVNVVAFGARGMDTFDSAPFIRQAKAWRDYAGGTLYFPPGRFKIASNTVLDGSVELADGAVLVPTGGAVVTLSGSADLEDRQYFDVTLGGTISFVGTGRKEIKTIWFGAETDPVAVAAALTAASAAGAMLYTPGVTVFPVYPWENAADVVNRAFDIGDVRRYGGVASAADSTTALQRAFNNAKTGGTIVLTAGDWKYTTLNLDDAYNVKVIGNGGSAASNSGGSTGRTRLICTAGGSGVGISLGSAQGIEFEGVRLCFSNPAFTGKLVRTGWSAANSDAAHLSFRRCAFEGISGAVSAASLLDLNKAIIVNIDNCAFRYGVRAITGKQAGGYSNVVTISGACEFAYQQLAPIYNPGESWTIENNGFEGLVDGKAGAVDMDPTFFAFGFKYSNNWHGDQSVAGNDWVRIRALGCSIDGANFFTTLPGDAAVTVMKDTQGIVLQANKFAGGTAINFADTPVYGAVIQGNDLFGAAELIRNQSNAIRPVIQGNGGLNAPTVTGSRESNPAVAQFLTQLASVGHVIDGTVESSVRTLDVNSTTPTVAGDGASFQTNNSAATAITNLTGGINGKVVRIAITDPNTSFVNGANMKLKGGVNFAPASGNHTIMLLFNGGLWLELSRSQNS